jgi:transcriptional regulator with XRE-family HTH domain
MVQKPPEAKFLGPTIKGVRKQMGLSQSEFGILVGNFSQSMIVAWEKSEPIIRRSAEIMASKLGIPFEQLWGGDITLKDSQFLLPPADIQSLKPMIKRLVKLRNQWGKFGDDRKERLLKAIKTIAPDEHDNLKLWLEDKKAPKSDSAQLKFTQQKTGTHG